MVSNSRNKIHQTLGWKLCEPYTGDARQSRAKLVRLIKGSFPFWAAEERGRRRNGNGIMRACKRGDMNEQSIFRAYSTEIDLFLPRGAIPVRFMTDSTSNESGWRMGGGQALATSANCWLVVSNSWLGSVLERLRGTRGMPRPTARAFPTKFPNDF